MRILLAKLMVVVTGLLIILLAILFAVIRNRPDDSALRAADEVPVPPPDIDAAPEASGTVGRPQSATVVRGRAVYVEQRCSMCHSLEGEGNTRSPLDGVSGRLTEREIRLWIVEPKQMNPAVAKRGYRLSEADLDALVAYLMAKQSP